MSLAPLILLFLDIANAAPCQDLSTTQAQLNTQVSEIESLISEFNEVPVCESDGDFDCVSSVAISEAIEGLQWYESNQSFETPALFSYACELNTTCAVWLITTCDGKLKLGVASDE